MEFTTVPFRVKLPELLEDGAEAFWAGDNPTKATHQTQRNTARNFHVSWDADRNRNCPLLIPSPFIALRIFNHLSIIYVAKY